MLKDKIIKKDPKKKEIRRRTQFEIKTKLDEYFEFLIK